jgi:hypothetical protein
MYDPDKPVGQNVLDRVEQLENARTEAQKKLDDLAAEPDSHALSIVQCWKYPTLDIMRWLATKWECPTCKRTAMTHDLVDLPKELGTLTCQTCWELREMLHRWAGSLV